MANAGNRVEERYHVQHAYETRSDLSYFEKIKDYTISQGRAPLINISQLCMSYRCVQGCCFYFNAFSLSFGRLPVICYDVKYVSYQLALS